MMKDAKLMIVHALSPLHAGTGQGIGVIDLPIAREKATNLPYVPGSSIKGVLRDKGKEQYEKAYKIDKNEDKKKKQKSVHRHVFGPDTGSASDHAGSAQFGDARLLLLPVRSVSGTFAWVTSPYLLARLKRDCVHTNAQLPESMDVAEKKCIVAKESALTFDLGGKRQVVLEDARLDTTQNDLFSEWAEWLGKLIFPNKDAWQTTLQKRLCIVHDDVFSFLLETGTEVIARNKLDDETKTVDTKVGGLWYEEALPTETVLVSIIVATPTAKSKMNPQSIHKHIETLIKEPVQLGGSATIGRGVCRLTIEDGGV